MDTTQSPLIETVVMAEKEMAFDIDKESPQWVPPFNDINDINDIIDNVNLPVVPGNIEIADSKSYEVLTRSYDDLEKELNASNKEINELKANIDYTNFCKIVKNTTYNVLTIEWIFGRNKPTNIINEFRLLNLWNELNNVFIQSIESNRNIRYYNNEIEKNNKIIEKRKQEIEKASKMRNKNPDFNVESINTCLESINNYQEKINLIISTIEKPDVLIMYSTFELYKTAVETYFSINKQIISLKNKVEKLQSSMTEYKVEIKLELWRGRYQHYAKKYQLDVYSKNLFRVCNMHKLNDVLYKTRFLCRCKGPDEHDCGKSNCSLCDNIEFNYFQNLDEDKHTFKFTKNNLTTCTGMIGSYSYYANVKFISFNKEIVNQIGFIHNPKLTIDDIVVKYYT